MTSESRPSVPRQRIDQTRSLLEPHPSRLPVDHPQRSQILAAHEAAVAAGKNGYQDPVTGRFAVCATYLAERGWCCDAGCRHCPYLAG